MTAGDPVPAPPDWIRIMSYDLSPMRPDDYGTTQAARWRDAVACRNAYDAGVADAAAEQATFDGMEAVA